MKLKQENTREAGGRQDDATLPLSSLFSGKHKSGFALNGGFEMIITSFFLLFTEVAPMARKIETELALKFKMSAIDSKM